jgi:hypothetical protein
MSKIPNRPFLTQDFAADGAGIDFLGLRWANLEIASKWLLPDVNNATRDAGVYLLSAWIVWKFGELCKSPKEYTYSRFIKFREAVEVAITYVTREDSPATAKFGKVHARIGALQKLKLPQILAFKAVGRRSSTSAFAAPQYGPSLKYLGFIGADAVAEDWSSTKIPTIGRSPEVIPLLLIVDEQLRQSRFYESLESIVEQEVNGPELDDLGLWGLHAGFVRDADPSFKKQILSIVLTPEHPQRLLTAALIIETSKQIEQVDPGGLRRAWLTGLRTDGSVCQYSTLAVRQCRERWGVLELRQYQRYVIELFMKCFEVAVRDGYSTLPTVSHWMCSRMDSGNETFRSVIVAEASAVTKSIDLHVAAMKWERSVHGEHGSFLWIDDPENVDGEPLRAMKMLARWWLSVSPWIQGNRQAELLDLGGDDRVSIRSFHHWLSARVDRGILDLVEELLERFVFAQHVRVALSRFDGEGQRLRFMLGDHGIAPVRSSGVKLGEGLPSWMADRLDAFIDLLTDLDVVRRGDSKSVLPGSLSRTVERSIREIGESPGGGG